MSDQRRRVITVALMLSNVMSGLDNTIINTALPRIIADLRNLQDLVADNPGQWLVHCHNLYHGESGMMTVLSYQL